MGSTVVRAVPAYGTKPDYWVDVIGYCNDYGLTPFPSLRGDITENGEVVASYVLTEDKYNADTILVIANPDTSIETPFDGELTEQSTGWAVIATWVG